MLGLQRSHCHGKTNLGFVVSSEGVGRKRQISSTTDRYCTGILDGRRDRQIRRLRLPRHSYSGSNQKGEEMGAGYVNLRKRKKRQKRKVGRKEEASSLNHRELAAFVFALWGTPVTNPMLYFCHNPAILSKDG